MITLTTDFGLRDPYVAEMKAVILSICPEAQVIDITHEIAPFDIQGCAYALLAAAPYFPKETVHVAVVDPGVGTKRKALLIETKESFFIGPDNGTLILASERQSIKHIFELTNRRFMLPHVSGTFHGRDIFAPTAAYLASGERPESFGPEVKKTNVLGLAAARKEAERIVGKVFHIDSFGNIVTDIPEEYLASVKVEQTLFVEMGKSIRSVRFCGAYGEADRGKLLALIGSQGFLEIAINQGNAARVFHVKPGDRVILSLRNQ